MTSSTPDAAQLTRRSRERCRPGVADPKCRWAGASRPRWNESRPAVPSRVRTFEGLGVGEELAVDGPELGARSVVSVRTVVGFPTPFGPRKPNTRPRTEIEGAFLRRSSAADVSSSTACLLAEPMSNSILSPGLNSSSADSLRPAGGLRPSRTGSRHARKTAIRSRSVRCPRRLRSRTGLCGYPPRYIRSRRGDCTLDEPGGGPARCVALARDRV